MQRYFVPRRHKGKKFAKVEYREFTFPWFQVFFKDFDNALERSSVVGNTDQKTTEKRKDHTAVNIDFQIS